MTEAEALALPRRELDALVAEKVMNVGIETFRDHPQIIWLYDDGWSDNPKRYSTDIEAAWEVIDKLLDYWWLAVQVNHTYQGTVVTLCPHPCHPSSETEDGWREPKDITVALDPRDAGEDNMSVKVTALAICLSALKAVGVISDA